MTTEATTPARWELYRLLAEPVRLRLMALAAEEELAVGELAELLGEVQPNVSKHLAPLRQAGVLRVRRQGTWTLVRLDESFARDPVVADALHTGKVLCERDGSLGRVADVVRAREKNTREFFSRLGRDARNGASAGAPSELAAYLMALAPHMAKRGLAVDAGTGDGRLLEVLAPLFERVVAVDRSGAQLSLCAERVSERGFKNVELIEGELDGREATKAVGRAGADVVVASRVLHHAPRPGEMVRQLAMLTAPGGRVVVIDYERHEDESLRSQQADLWLGFEAAELQGYAREAGLTDLQSTKIPGVWCGTGHDRHIPWQVMAASRPKH